VVRCYSKSGLSIEMTAQLSETVTSHSVSREMESESDAHRIDFSFMKPCHISEVNKETSHRLDGRSVSFRLFSRNLSSLSVWYTKRRQNVTGTHLLQNTKIS
jgi:hypothetical protein